MVDWPSTLWPVSFKGVPFYVERDTETGGRRVAVHEFWRRDDPFLEDGGAKPVQYRFTAYVANDALAASVEAVLAVLNSEGPGVLVRPLAGPVQARCTECERETERDKMGYAAITATFVREGSSFGLASLAQLGNAIFAAGDALAAAAGTLFATLSLAGQVNRVAEESAAAFQNVVAGVEVVRRRAPVAADVSADVRDALAALYTEADGLVTSSGADAAGLTRLIDAARDLSGGMDAGDAATAFGAQLDVELVTPVVYTATPANLAIAANAVLVGRLERLVHLVAYADALARVSFRSRREGIAARAAAGERFARAIGEAGDARDEAVVVALQDLGGQVADYLSRTINTLAPVATVTAPRSMPALWWSHRLYGTPLRVQELVDRNRVRHPAFMPEKFEALTS